MGQQVLSLGKGVGHPIFEPLEGVGHESFRVVMTANFLQNVLQIAFLRF